VRSTFGVKVERVKVDDVDHLGENDSVPIVVALLPAGDELDGRVDQLESFAPLTSGLGICGQRTSSSERVKGSTSAPSLERRADSQLTVRGGLLPDLPIAPDLVSKSDVLDLVRFIVAILATLVGPERVALPVHVLQPVEGALEGSGSHVEAYEGFGAELLAPCHEL
jgi:hypothetical protein